MKKHILFLLTLIAAICFGGCSDDDKEPLTAKFSAEKQVIIVGEEISFSDESSGNPSMWNWTFEGGSPEESILFSPKVKYNTPGKYAVKLTVGRGNNESAVIEEVQYITVNYPGQITVDFSADKTSVLSGESVQFTDHSVGYPIKWEWTFVSDGGITLTSEEQNPLMTFEPGIYTVTLKASNPETSSQATKETYVTVIDPYLVSAEFKAVYPVTYGGGDIQFEDKSIGNAENWAWTFEGGTPATSNEQNPKIKYNTPGKYKVKLVASNSIHSSTKELEAYVSVIPGNGMVAFYPFEGNGADIGPNQLTANVKSVVGSGNVVFDKESNKAGFKAAQFSNLDSKNIGILEIADHEGFNFDKGDFSISLWMKTTEDRQMALWMEGGGQAIPYKKQCWFRTDKVSAAQLSSFVTEDQSGVWCNNKEVRLTDGKWHHVICMRVGNELRTYINGVLKAKGTGTVKEASDTTPFLIGCMSTPEGGYKAYYTGLIDDFVVYKRALTDDEISLLYNY